MCKWVYYRRLQILCIEKLNLSLSLSLSLSRLRTWLSHFLFKIARTCLPRQNETVIMCCIALYAVHNTTTLLNHLTWLIILNQALNGCFDINACAILKSNHLWQENGTDSTFMAHEIKQIIHTLLSLGFSYANFTRNYILLSSSIVASSIVTQRSCHHPSIIHPSCWQLKNPMNIR